MRNSMRKAVLDVILAIQRLELVHWFYEKNALIEIDRSQMPTGFPLMAVDRYEVLRPGVVKRPELLALLNR